MGSYKRPRVFDPLDLETIHLVYEAASAQLAARHPPSNPDEESVRQEALKIRPNSGLWSSTRYWTRF